MRLKILLRRIFLIAASTSLIIYVGFVYYLILRSSKYANSSQFVKNDSSIPVKVEKKIKIGLPTRLMIPKISIDSSVENVGLTSKGAVDVPQAPENVAWYGLGPRPGESGTSVITGHYGGWRKGVITAFNNLYKLRKGDKIYVEDERGTVISFVVSENRRYDPEADDSKVFDSNDGKSHLSLITCEGVWDEHTQQYTQRLVVFADKI